jgi:CTP synthase
MFSNVPLRRVFSMHDRPSIYTIPDAMREGGLDREVLSLLNLHQRVDQRHEDEARENWRQFVRKLTSKRRFKATVGITGKYASLRDAYASIDKALEHSAAHLNTELDIKWVDTTQLNPSQVGAALEKVDAVIVPGGFGVRGTEGKIACVRYCRENALPYLGICLGFQMAVVEFARNVCGLAEADSTEFRPSTPHPVIDMLPEQKKIEGLGGNMRLGGKDVILKPDTLASFLFDNQRIIRERFRHRYEVDPRYIEVLEQHGMVFSGRHPQHTIMQVLELPTSEHPYFIGAQFHPELTSRPLHPQPLFMGLVAAAIRHANPGVAPAEISTRWLPSSRPQGKPLTTA